MRMRTPRIMRPIGRLNGQFQLDHRAGARRAVDLEFPADALRALAHRGEAEPGELAAAARRRVEADAVVGYRHADRAVAALERDGGERRARMLADVPERLLHDADELQLGA